VHDGPVPNHVAYTSGERRETGATVDTSSAHPSAKEFERDLVAKGARPKSCVYVSTPITTGPLTLENSSGVAANDLIAKNVSHARDIVARTALKVDAIVIDPTQFDDVEGWEQPDYHNFWLEIIDVYVAQIVFCDGWEFSTGCCIEFLRAHELQLPRLDERLRPLLDVDSLDLLTTAIARMGAVGLTTTAQRRALHALAARAQDA